MDVSTALGAFTKPVGLDGPKVHHLPQWGEFGDPKRMDIITRIATMRGRDPRIASLAVGILKEAGVQPRDYKGQAAALLDFVQHKLYYVNEPGERLQDPTYTLKVGYGDCDDLVIVLGALLESVRLPWKVVISGTKGRKKVRYHAGDKFPGGEKKGYNWSHIYLMVGNRPFTPSKWSYAETTVRGAPLGWDVVDGDASAFPELQPNYGATMAYDLMEYGAAMQMPVSTPSLNTQLFPTTVAGANDMQLPMGSSMDIPSYSPGNRVIPKGLIKPGSRTWGQRRRLKRHGQGHSVPVHQGEQQADMVAVVVIAPNGKVLALHRGAGVKWMPGRWDLPGGKTHGAPARKAALKILHREAGIKAKPHQLRACSAVYHPGAGTSVFYVYRIKSKKPLVQVAKKEHQGWRWVDRRVLRKEYQTAPYVDVAFRACFRPGSLNPYTKGKRWKGGTSSHKTLILDPGITKAQLSKYNLASMGSYGAFEMPEALQKEYYGFPLWGLLAAGGAAYYFYSKK